MAKMWDDKHRNKPNKLHEIIPEIKPFFTNNLNRRDEVIIHRLRIGHTRMTHRFLMEDPLQREPVCNFFYGDDLTVKHIMIECQHFNRIRTNHYRVATMRDLFERVPYKHIINFLIESGLYS